MYNPAICAFLHISGAFDNTSHDVIKRGLEARRVGRAATRCIGEVPSARAAETAVGKQVFNISTTRGTSRG